MAAVQTSGGRRVLEIFDSAFQTISHNARRLLTIDLNSEAPTLQTTTNNDDGTDQSDVSAQNPKCTCCNVEFNSPTRQREHYKLDWHRYNLNRRLCAQTAIGEDEFARLSLNDALSQSSESSEDDEDSEIEFRGHAFFTNDDGAIFSLYKCLLLDEVNINYERGHLWTVLMVSGGHFAGAVFQDAEVMMHKTFHSYTVRAKQGGAQSTKDNQSGGGTHPKSAGASLRRYNNVAFIQHVQEIIGTWKEQLDNSTFVFYRAAGPQNRAILFSGKRPPLLSNDFRLRPIPFSTRRPTFAEVQNVYKKLSTVNLYESKAEASEVISTPIVKKPNKVSSRAREEESSSTVDAHETSSEAGPEGTTSDDNLLFTCLDEIDVVETLEAFHSAVSQRPKKQRKKKKGEPKQQQAVATEPPDSVPSDRVDVEPTTKLTEEEKRLKQRQKRAAKREQKKEQRKEEKEKSKFLELCDRDKRIVPTCSRCFMCGKQSDKGAAWPFEYSNNHFCSIVCLKEHRATNCT